MKKILIAEDNKDILSIEKDYLEINGFLIDTVESGDKVISMLENNQYDLLLLDIMMPGKNGYEICREVRTIYDMPIIMVTAKTESIDKIMGLNCGADDYITKPFDPSELVARVKSHLSRYERLTGKKKEHEVECIVTGHLKIYPKSYKVFVKEREIKFATKEFEVLLLLARNSNIVLSKEVIFEKIWGLDYMGDAATVTVHINRIREKIEEDTTNPQYIDTIWGVGYRFNKILI